MQRPIFSFPDFVGVIAWQSMHSLIDTRPTFICFSPIFIGYVIRCVFVFSPPHVSHNFMDFLIFFMQPLFSNYVIEIGIDLIKEVFQYGYNGSGS